MILKKIIQKLKPFVNDSRIIIYKAELSNLKLNVMEEYTDTNQTQNENEAIVDSLIEKFVAILKKDE